MRGVVELRPLLVAPWPLGYMVPESRLLLGAQYMPMNKDFNTWDGGLLLLEGGIVSLAPPVNL